MSEIKQESPLVGRPEAVRGSTSRGDSSVTLRERPFLGHISLRGQSDDQAFTAAASKVLGVALPTTPNTQAAGKGIIACWMGPTEWLLLTEDEACQDWLDRLRDVLAEVHAGVVELSGGQTLIEIRGPYAADTLAKGTTIDLHPRSFGAEQCTRTLLAHSTVFIRVLEPGTAFQVVVRRSFADHIWHWLCDSAAEYGYKVEPPESALAQAAAAPEPALAAESAAPEA